MRPHQPERAQSLGDGTTSEPRIYVASLADYNNGRLVGRWFRADRAPGTLSAEIARMLKESGEPGAEEWAIHDYEGFGPIRLSESQSLRVVSAVAIGIAVHGLEFADWLASREELSLDGVAEYAQNAEAATRNSRDG